MWPLFRVSIISVFLQKGKLVLRSVLSEGHFFQGERYFWDLLTPVTFYRYFQRFATFKGPLLPELCGITLRNESFFKITNIEQMLWKLGLSMLQCI